MGHLRIVLAAVFFALSARPGAATAADIHIGFVGTLTGPQANMAQDRLDGFQLAVKHLGGRLGGNEFTFAVMDDPQAPHAPEAALQAVQKLLQSERVQVLVTSTRADTTAALLPLASAAKTFVISLSAPSPNLAGKDCSPFFFSLSGLDETMHELAGQYLETHGYHEVAVVGPDSAERKEATAAFLRGFKGQVTEITSRRGQMDFGDELRRLREAPPDAVYLLYTGGMAVEFIRQFDQGGLKKELPLFGPGTTLDQTVLAAAGPAALDFISFGPWSDDLDTPANRRMTADFESEYGRPASLFAAQGYDAAMLIDTALKSVDKKFNDADALRNALRRADFPNTRGSLRFDTDHFPIQTYLLREAVQDAPRQRMSNEQRGILVRDLRNGYAGECAMRWVADPPPKS